MEIKESHIGVIGSGSFGTAIANLLAVNNKVYLYVREDRTASEINQDRIYNGRKYHNNITATNDRKILVTHCKLIFPIVPSSNFKEMLLSFKEFLTTEHILIHGTKGLYIDRDEQSNELSELSLEELKTMSQLIITYTSVTKVGCLAGPNLATEILQGQLAATVIASNEDQTVINIGKKALNSNLFKVFGSFDLTSIEFAGVLKNYIAIGAGMAAGLNYGDNAKSLLITRGMSEMIHIGKSLGLKKKAFLGLAGIGDLMATCNSKLSRNYRVGFMLAKGMKLDEILHEIGEVAEGVKTLQIIHALSHYKFKAPIASVLYNIVFNDKPITEGVEFLMKIEVNEDVDFISNS